MDDLANEARLDTKAFRENTVYDSEGDPIRLTANADRLDAYAARITALEAQVERLTADKAGYERGIRDAADCQPSTAENPNEDAYQWCRFDAVMEYQRAILAKLGDE